MSAPTVSIKQHFLTEVKARFTALFEASKRRESPTPEQRLRLEGFIQAGVFLGISTNDDMQHLMEEVHFNIFGQTILEREIDHTTVWKSSEIDYAVYDKPPWERAGKASPFD